MWYLIAWLVGTAGFIAGLWWGRMRSREPVPGICGACLAERERGPRRQLFVEIWDSYGMQYKQWAVGGLGDLPTSKPVGPWLLSAVAAEVVRLEAVL